MVASWDSSFLLFFLVCFLLTVNPISGNAELRALMELKSSLDPENRYLASWDGDGDPCGGGFEGVACNQHGKVANISLQGKGLTGKLTAAVADLKCLSGLYLHYNYLTGEIPRDIANLTELTDLYLNVNNFSGFIPTEIGRMASLQVLQLCCNQLTGIIPEEMGFLKKLTVLALERNQLTGQIPASLGDLGALKRLHLNVNKLSGPIPIKLANLPQLRVLDVQNNTLSGSVPPSLKRLNDGFHFDNNPGLCGNGFTSLRACSSWDNMNQRQPLENRTAIFNVPQAAVFPLSCEEQQTTNCSKSSSKSRQTVIVVGSVSIVLLLIVIAFIFTIYHRRQKQKVANKSDTSEETPSPLVVLEHSRKWDSIESSQDCNGMCEYRARFNFTEVESATHHFSDGNLLGKGKFSAVYKGILKDGSIVAIKSINKTNCKTEADGFIKGMSLLNSLEHENLMPLKGFCCSKSRNECFLIYDFAVNGSLSSYLDERKETLDWATRVGIINGIAKGIEYLHRNEPNKPSIIHQNISVEKVLLNQQWKPLILDSGLLKLLADDVVYSALKVSAAFGYMAPEYVTTGRFTEKSDVYAFGIIILQVLSGRRKLSRSTKTAAESGNFADFITGNYSISEASRLTKIAMDCTDENPENRPSMTLVCQELL